MPHIVLGNQTTWINVKRFHNNYAVFQSRNILFDPIFYLSSLHSILRGVAFGYVLYIMIGLFTGDMIDNSKAFYTFYTTCSPAKKHPAIDEGESMTWWTIETASVRLISNGLVIATPCHSEFCHLYIFLKVSLCFCLLSSLQHFLSLWLIKSSRCFLLPDGHDADKEEDSDKVTERGRSMSMIGKMLAVMDMESHDVKMESI